MTITKGQVVVGGLEELDIGGLRDILEEQLWIMTRGRSSTISLDKAKELLESIRYVLRFQSQDDSHLDTSAYGKALDNLIRLTKTTIQWYGELMAMRLPIDNLVYNETFEQAIPSYLANYDPRTGAHQTDCDMDYPLARDEMRETGILYIIGYLRTFALENAFCSFFGHKAVGRVLERFASRMGVDGREFPVNLFLLCLEQAILVNMTSEGIHLKRGRNMLLFRKDMYRELSAHLNGKPPVEVQRLLRTSANEVIERTGHASGGFGDEGRAYMALIVEETLPRLVTCVMEDRLDGFVHLV